MAVISTEELGKVVTSYPKEKRYSLALLLDVQKQFGYIPKEGFEIAAKHLDIKTASLYAMATFFRALSLTPKGKHVIRICDGTACHIRGSTTLLDALNRTLKIQAGQTTKDGLFTLEIVNCLGACAIAPVMVVDEQYYPKVKPAEIGAICGAYRTVKAKSSRKPAGTKDSSRKPKQPKKQTKTRSVKSVRGKKNGK